MTDATTGSLPADGVLPALALLIALAAIYLLIAMFRSAVAELNPRSVSRILSSRGLEPREGESYHDLPAALRMSFDLLHHLVLAAAMVACVGAYGDAGSGRPLLAGLITVVAGVVVLQTLARVLALSDPESALRLTLFVLALFHHAMRPLVVPLIWLIRRFRAIGRARRAASSNGDAAEEEIEAFIDAGQEEGLLEADEGHLIRQVVEFHDSVVREVMTPRTDVVAIPSGATIAQARDLFARERHSRIPVYRDLIDNVQGIITLKDLVARWGTLPEDSPVETIMIPPFFVPETKPVSELLKEFQARRVQLAIVVDEYGGTAGVVSVEDLLEELVGDIQEEHEEEEQPVVPQNDGTYLAEGSASIEELESAVGVEVPGEGFDTVAGLVYTALGRIPEEGEVVEVNGLRLEILRADTRRIERVRVTRLVESGAS